MKPLRPARLVFRDGVPCSTDYDDVYFSREGGLDEVRHVFLAGNDLPRRWQGARSFTIGETGFGTGLNFLLSVAEWRRRAPARARLHYVSVERHPFTQTDLHQVLEPFSALATEREALLGAWPPLVEGLHRRELFAGRVTLTLLFGDAGEMLAGLDARVDAWYLDGFAPARNPQMWQAELFRQIARLSRPGATFATFTAAGNVRRGLAEAGFTVHKRHGFGRKREMLAGAIATPPGDTTAKPWFVPPGYAHEARRAIVVGAGLAGATTAFALAERDWQVQVIEAGTRVAAEASGNPAGVLMPRLNADMDAGARFHLAAFLNTVAWLEALEGRGFDTGFHRSGVLQLDIRRRHVQRIHPALPPDVVTAVEREAAQSLAGSPLAGDALLYPAGGWLSPPRLCRQLLAHPRIGIRTGLTVERLAFADDRWQLHTKTEILEAPIVILANGADALRTVPELCWNLQLVRGQLSYLEVPRPDWPALPVCGDGYVTPTEDPFLVIGATFETSCHDPAMREADHRANLDTLRQSLPTLATYPVIGGRVGFRTTSPDRLPVLGAVPDADFFRTAYADLRHGPHRRPLPPARYLPGLHVTTAHGSRGLTTCPLAAMQLAALLEGEPLPLLRDQQQATNPGRFLIRKLKRGTDC